MHADALSVATLNRRLAALAKVHRSHGSANPTSSELVKSVIRGLRRVKGTAQRQARPLLKEDLILALDATGEGLRGPARPGAASDRVRGRFSEVGIGRPDCGDVERVRQGMILTLRRSKTDQAAEGRKIGIPLARGRWCPVGTLEQWLVGSGIVDGTLFRPIDRHSRIGLKPLSGEAACLIVKERVRAVGSIRRDIQVIA